MAINARTFQVLYIIRERAVADHETKAEHISAFIMARRKDAPGSYSRAYIAPGALDQILQRMTTGEGLLTLEDGEYLFTPKGSQMADLLDGLDACSDKFIDNYKELVSLAVLQQRLRLGQGPANPREVAAISNISLDSARRGLSDLVEAGTVVEDRSSRTPTYAACGIEVDDEPDQCEGCGGATDDLNDESLCEECSESLLDESLPDKGSPAPRDILVADALADIDDDDDGWATSGKAPPALPDEDDLLPLHLGQILQDDEKEPDDPFGFTINTLPEVEDEPTEAEEPEGEKVPGPYDWESVTEAVRVSHIARARACGMTLSGYFGALNQEHERKLRIALFNDPDAPGGQDISKHQEMIAEMNRKAS